MNRLLPKLLKLLESLPPGVLEKALANWPLILAAALIIGLGCLLGCLGDVSCCCK